MNEDIKVINDSLYGKTLRITLPIRKSMIKRINTMVIEHDVTRLVIVRESSREPVCSLKFLNNIAESKRITSLELYSYFYDFDCVYRFENLESLDCFIFNDETLDLSRFKKLKTLSTTQLEPYENLDKTIIERLNVVGSFGSTLINAKLDPGKLSQLHQLKDLRLFEKVKDFSFEDVTELDNLERVIIVQCNIKNFNGIEKFPSLKSVVASYCSSLSDISAIKKLPNLLSLDIGPCPRLKDLNVLASNDNLRALCLNSYKNVDIEIIKTLKELRFLYLYHCNPIPSIKFIDDLKKMVGLTLLSTKIIDGDLTPAMRLKDTDIMVMRHYNIDEDKLPSDMKYSYPYSIDLLLNS